VYLLSMFINFSCFPFFLVDSRMAYGNESGLAIIDIVQKVCLFNVASPDLYGAQDPYSRVPRSPKRSEPPYSTRDEQRSPSIDQVSYFVCREISSCDFGRATTCCE
jgi:syntaxin-binding protein 5